MVSSKWKLLSQSDDGDCMIHILSLLRESGVCNGDILQATPTDLKVLIPTIRNF